MFGRHSGSHRFALLSESAKTMVVIERDIEKINSVEIEEVTSTDNDIKEIEYADESIKR